MTWRFALNNSNVILKIMIRIHHECEGWIEKSVQKITLWHYEVCRVMTNGDSEGPIFLSHTNSGFFFSLITKCLVFIQKHAKKDFQENSEYADMRHGDIILT